MNNILISSFEMIPTASIVKSYIEYFPVPTRFRLLRKVTASDFNWASIIMVIRGNDPVSARFIKLAKKYGKVVYLFMDDDLLDGRFYDESNKLKRLMYRSTLNSVIMSDRIVVCNRYLGLKYHNEYQKEIGVLLTPVDENEIISKESDNKRKITKIVYPAHMSHKNWFDNFVLPALGELANKYGKNISFTSVGLRLDLSLIDNKIICEQYDSMKYDDYCEFMDHSDFDIGIAPLDDSYFSKCKYYNKFIEYAKRGIAGVYTNSSPYNQIVKNGYNGILVSNTIDEWKHAIESLIVDHNLSKIIGINSQATLRSELNIKKVEKGFLDTCPEINCSMSNMKSILFLSLSIFDIVFRVYKKYINR